MMYAKEGVCLHFSIVQRGFVEVLQCLSDEEQGQEEHIDPPPNPFVLLDSLSISAHPTHVCTGK